MIKEGKIKDLIYNKVVKVIEGDLGKMGFKFIKSKKYFLRQQKNIHQIIYLSNPSSPLTFNDKTEQIFLSFKITGRIEIPDFDKWYQNIVGEHSNFFYGTESLTAQTELSLDDFDREDFYNATPSQDFKQSITCSLMESKQVQHGILGMDDLIKDKLHALISKLEMKSDIENLFEAREHPFSRVHILLLLFGGFVDKANDFLDKTYQRYLSMIEEKIALSESKEAGDYIKSLHVFVKSVQKATGKIYDNPYMRKIKVLNPQNNSFNFSPNIQFKEKVRLDISQYVLNSYHINSKGEVLLFLDNKTIITLNNKFEVTLEKEIATPAGYYEFSQVKTGVIEATDEFYVNNFVIRKDHSILELPLISGKEKKSKNLKDYHITDFAYSAKTGKYHILFGDQFLQYNEKAELERSFAIHAHSNNKIYVEKGWIISQKQHAENTILDSEGQTLKSYEIAKGNHRYEFSDSFAYLVCFFYAAKSQFYDLTNSKKSTLWAHPTFLDSYKEKLYSDINHNFGMTLAKFSPDEKYLVGGADHGKYVAWTLPKLDRIELIPKTEFLEQLKTYTRSVFTEQGPMEVESKPELITIENQTFLKNRGNDVSNIIFIDKGDIFLTEIKDSNCMLSWDRDFNSLTYHKILGPVLYHSNTFLTEKTKNELIIYERNN